MFASHFVNAKKEKKNPAKTNKTELFIHYGGKPFFPAFLQWQSWSLQEGREAQTSDFALIAYTLYTYIFTCLSINSSVA